MEQRYKCAIRQVLSFCLLSLMVSWNAFGQGTEFEAPIETEDGDFSLIEDFNQPLRDELNMKDMNRVTIQQMGYLNDAFIQQYSDGTTNLIKVLQNGDENLATLTQTGNYNATAIYQYEDGNIYTGNHLGNNISNTVVQTGFGNYINQDLMGSELDFQIIQRGNGHILNQVETRPGIGYKVTQTGLKGMEISIINNTYK